MVWVSRFPTPYRVGTDHASFEPLDFIARLAALVLKPGINLTRFHGVSAPNRKHRAKVTPAKLGKGNKPKASGEAHEQTPVERRAAMTWAQRTSSPAEWPCRAGAWRWSSWTPDMCHVILLLLFFGLPMRSRKKSLKGSGANSGPGC